jgi:hypothetical protein
MKRTLDGPLAACALNPQSSILNPQSSILNPQSSILNPQSSIMLDAQRLHFFRRLDVPVLGDHGLQAVSLDGLGEAFETEV